MVGPLAVIVGLAAHPLAPAGDAELLQLAIERTEGSALEGWAYTETAVKNGRVTVSTFDPRRPDGELIRVDGQPPTDEDRLEDAKHGFGVKITEFVMTPTFEPVASGGPAFPRSATVRIAGRALLFKKIEEEVEVTYSDYQHVGV